MALNETQAVSSGVWGAIKGALGIFSDVNKAEGVTENTNPTPIDEYESSYSEEEILMLISQWKKSYAAYYSDVEPSQKLSFEYWIGKQRSDESEQVQGVNPLVDNKIFESIETFIPIATRANPDPLVSADNTDAGQSLANDIKQALVHEADRQKLRKILKKLIRNWIIHRIGILKVGYNVVLDQIETDVPNPKRMIFDRDGHFDESGLFTGEYIGEKKQATASRLAEMFPKKAADIMRKAQEKKGTKLEYMEWWYRNADVFYTMEDFVLGKFKNPHWNYDVPPKEGELGESTQPGIPGQNHFKEPRNPYIGLCIFSTGQQPHDDTSLILQNIGLQDMINRRMRQIDRNVEGMNNGMVVNDQFTAEQASQAASALRRGTAIRYPGRDAREGVVRFPAPALPDQVFEQLRDGREQLGNIFGISGSTPQGVNSQDTVRGKILVNQLDSSRIGGGITEYIEQAADTWYNWLVQMMFVHYTDEHYITTAGSKEGADLVMIKNTNFMLTKTLDITVKEGSLVPKDPLTQRNEAIDLWSADAIDPRTLFKRLDFPDADEATKELLLWQMVQKGTLPPQMYIPDFPQQPMMMPGQVPGQPGAVPGDNNPGAPGDENAPGAGGPSVNPIGPANSAPESQSKQLIQSVPIK